MREAMTFAATNGNHAKQLATRNMPSAATPVLSSNDAPGEDDPSRQKLDLMERDVRDGLRSLGQDADTRDEDTSSGPIQGALDLIDKARKDILDPITDASTAYGRFYAALQEALAKLIENVKGVDDDPNHVQFDTGPGRQALEELVSRFGNAPLAHFDNKDAADAFLKRLGLDGLKAAQVDGQWVIQIDMAPINNILGSLPENDKDKAYATMDTAAYQAWVSGKDSREEVMKNINRVLLDRFSRDYQLYEVALRLLQDTFEALKRAMQEKIDRTSG